MKRFNTTLLLFFLFAQLFSQTNLVGYEYWFNNDYANVQVTTFAPVTQHQLNININTSSLPDGVNVINIRYKDENNIYSSTLSKIFYKNTEQLFSNKTLVEYEYWFNNDYANVQIIPFTSNPQHQLSTSIDASNLPDGINVFNIRYKDENNIYSSTISKIFYKNTEQLFSNKALVEYEYWFNNDYANVQVIPFTSNPQHQLSTSIDASSLSDGINVLNIRYKDENNHFSSTISSFFYKTSSSIVSNKIVGYKYWFDNDHSNVNYVLLGTATKQLNLSENIDMTQIAKGSHSINFQLLDSIGKWSLVTTDTILKTSFPIADFTISKIENCDSTTVNFTNNSIDGDTYLWNFGDGFTDSNINTQHTYYSSGTYLASLTVTDTITLADSTLQIPITIIGATSDSVLVTECFEYTSPSGNFVFNVSGVYNDTIPNNWGCDSIITLNLTINTVDTSVTENVNLLSSNATGATYQWLDCNNAFNEIIGETNQNYSPATSGVYAVEVTENGCIDTSNCYQITVVGVPEHDLINLVSIYPNPTTKLLTIEWANTFENVTIKLKSITGQEIDYSSLANTNKVNLDLSKNTKGIYFVEVYSNNQLKSTHKVVKQ